MEELNCKDFILSYVTPTLEAPTKFFHSRIRLPFPSPDSIVMNLLPPEGNKQKNLVGGNKTNLNTFQNHWVTAIKKLITSLPASLIHFTF